MNRTSLTAVSLVLVLSLCRCASDPKSADAPAAASSLAPAELPPAPSVGPDAGAAPDSAQAAAAESKPDAGKPDVLSDEQIAAVADTANTAEIEQGKIARLKSKDPEVQHFAARMIAAHEEAKKNQDKLKLPTAESSLANMLGTDSASTLSTLKSSDGKAFDKTYIDAQVTAHQKLLDALNDKLLPNVKNPDLKAYLTQILPHVTRHLKEAQELQHTLDSKTAAVAASSKDAKSPAK